MNRILGGLALITLCTGLHYAAGPVVAIGGVMAAVSLAGLWDSSRRAYRWR